MSHRRNRVAAVNFRARSDTMERDRRWVTEANAKPEEHAVPNPDGDRQVLAAMRQAGADLNKPAHTMHCLLFRSEDAAKRAAEELTSAGYERVEISPEAGGSLLSRVLGRRKFACIAETHAVPQESAVLATTVWMERLAEKFGGEYDGWQASIER